MNRRFLSPLLIAASYRRFLSPLLIAASLLSVPVTATATLVISVDVDNQLLNPQAHNPPDHTDTPGPGISDAAGDLYYPDNFYSGIIEGTAATPWVWNPDPLADNGLGTIDTIAPGGNVYAAGGQHIANGLPARTGDANGYYLGLGGANGNREYAIYMAPFVVGGVDPISYFFTYQWAAAGGTLVGGTELLIGKEMGVEFFFLNAGTAHDDAFDYAADTTSFKSDAVAYAGAGNQVWETATGTVTLDPGTYYWGFTVYGEPHVSIPDLYYATVDGISITAVPEPSSALVLGAIGSLGFLIRRRSFPFSFGKRAAAA